MWDELLVICVNTDFAFFVVSFIVAAFEALLPDVLHVGDWFLTGMRYVFRRSVNYSRGCTVTRHIFCLLSLHFHNFFLSIPKYSAFPSLTEHSPFCLLHFTFSEEVIVGSTSLRFSMLFKNIRSESETLLRIEFNKVSILLVNTFTHIPKISSAISSSSLSHPLSRTRNKLIYLTPFTDAIVISERLIVTRSKFLLSVLIVNIFHTA